MTATFALWSGPAQGPGQERGTHRTDSLSVLGVRGSRSGGRDAGASSPAHPPWPRCLGCSPPPALSRLLREALVAWPRLHFPASQRHGLQLRMEADVCV